MIASLAAILLDISLSAIVSDEGLPLGLATSGFTFSRVSYFWSLAFWGGILGLSRSRSLKGATVVALMVTLAGLLATIVGPASAVLMLPRTNVSALTQSPTGCTQADNG